MHPIRALLSAVGMYTLIPIPRREWTQRDFADSLTAFDDQQDDAQPGE